MLANVGFIHWLKFLFLAFDDSLSERSHFQPFTDVLRKICGLLMRKVMALSHTLRITRRGPRRYGGQALDVIAENKT